MRRLVIYSVLGIMFCAQTVVAQIQEGQKMLNIGIGFGSYLNVGEAKSTIPPIEISYESMFSEKVSLGGFVGYTASKEEYVFFGDNGITNKSSFLIFGGLVNYHFVNNSDWDVYAGGKLGYQKVSSKTEVTGDGGNESRGNPATSGIIFGAALGARKHFSETLSANAEVGYGIAIIRIGLTLKL